MAAFNRINSFAYDLSIGRHNFASGAGYNVVLSTAAANNGANSTVITNVTQITAASGYTANGNNVAIASTQGASNGNNTNITGANAVWTASGNNLGNATSNVEFATLFNTASPFSLVGYWDYGSAITVANTETFTVAWGANIYQITC